MKIERKKCNLKLHRQKNGCRDHEINLAESALEIFVAQECKCAHTEAVQEQHGM